MIFVKQNPRKRGSYFSICYDQQESCAKPAEGLGVTRKALSDVLNGQARVSPEMALRLELAGWGTAETWLQMQLQRDLWQARKRTQTVSFNVRRIELKELDPA